MKNIDSVLIPEINLNRNENLPKKGKKSINLKMKRIIALIAVAFFAFLVVLIINSYQIYRKGKIVENSLRNLVLAGKSQDINNIKKELKNSTDSIQELTKSYKRIAWLKIIPYFGTYISDFGHGLNASIYGIEATEVVIDTIEPYADIIGLKSGSVQAKSGNETTQDRINFVVRTIPEIIPKADILIGKITLIEKELAYIDPKNYPESLRGIKIRNKLEEGLDVFNKNAELIKNGKPLLETIPYLIGSESERKYLVLFQNDKELRPTGGFITAYSIAKVIKAKFEPVLSSDIYNLDNGYKPKIDAPDPFIKYLKGPYVISGKYKLRDMNWSPDFSDSMKLFTKEAQTAGIKNIDGVIAVDTQFLVNLLDVIGTIGVPGYGNFGTNIVPECNCPQVIYELESFADVEGPIVWSENEPGKIVFAPKNYDNRKKIIGPLMNSILANTLGQPKDKLPKLFEAMIKSLVEKHVIFYLTDGKAQKAVEEFGIAGRIDEYGGDYLHINDANLGGRKSNLYVTQDVNQEIKISKDGSLEKTLTITYKNPEKYDGWLNSVLPNWVRVYVPKGSQLIEFSGLEDSEKPYEDLGKTVFAGFFKLRPQGVAKLTVKYRLPFKVSKEYKLLVQKQPGKDKMLYTIKIGKQNNEYYLTTDREFKFTI